MGLVSTIQKATASAFKAIGDIPTVCTYTSVGVTEYDPLTGVYVAPAQNPSTGAYSPSGIPYRNLVILIEDYEAREIQSSGGTVLSTDQKASIPKMNLTPTPKSGDTITDPDEVVWTVENVSIDPAKALWVFQVRQ